MKILFFILIVLVSFQGTGQIFTESIGTVGGTISIAAHEAANGFDNDSYTMTGTGDVRNSSVSSGYVGATGSGNVFLTSTIGTNFQIAGIVTTTCTSLTISFGAHKSTTASDMSELIFEYSTDGAIYTSIPFPAQPTGAGTATWRLITVALPIGTENQANLRLRWRNTSTTPAFRLDDINLSGTCVTNTISTSNVTGGPFIVDCSTTDLGNVDYTSTGTFNVGNIFTAQLSNAAGSFASPINIGTVSGAFAEGVNPASTISITIPAGTATGAGYRIRVISSNPATTGTNNGSDISITNTPCPNSITTGAITGSPFTVDCSTGQNGTVAFTSIGTFNPGNIFTAQLSDASGSFASPTNIGSLDSTSSVGVNPGGTISFSLPAGIATGASYKIRIISTNPVLTGTESGVFTITLSGGPCTLIPPHITSVIINSCNPTCLEGNNELVFGNTGDYSLLVNTANFNISYNSTYPLVNYTDVLVTNAAKTAAVNTAAGCPGVYVDGVGATLPPNASFILAPTTLCIDALVWSGLCSSGPIYMIYQNDPSWNLGGTFKNGNTGGIRYFNSTMTTTSAETFSIDYDYNSTSLQTGAAGDGDYVTYGPTGGSAVYGDNNCILSPVLLPSTAVSFQGYYINSKNELFWKTTSEQNNSHFTILHSTDGFYFNQIGTVSGSGNSSELINYRFIHNNPNSGINYYKLRSTDYDGKTYDKGVISVEAEFNFSFFNSISSTIELATETDIEIYSLDGKLIQSALNTSSIPFYKSGMFYILDKRTGISERLFIP